MGQANYRVIITGNPLQNFDVAQVVQAAAQLFKCSEERARQYFTGKPTALKREMDQATAQRYRDRLASAGIDCRIEPVATSNGLTLALETAETPAAPAAKNQPGNAAAKVMAAIDTSRLSLVDDVKREAAPGEPIVTEFRCPKCNTVQDKGKECIQCGIIFAKYQPPVHNVAAVAETDEAEQRDDWDDIVAFVGENVEAYERKFRLLYNNGGKYKLQWHWPASIIPIPWMIFRKMYVWAAAYFIMTCLAPWYLLLLLTLLPGFFGNYLYYRHAVSRIGKITSSGAARRGEIVQAGGANSILMTIGISVLSGLIMAFIMYKLIFGSVMENAMQRAAGDMQFMSQTDDPGTTTTKAQLLMLKNTLLLQKQLASKIGNFAMPTNMEELLRVMGNPPNADRDFWGTPMEFHVEDDTLVFRSAGPDKDFDTLDDVVLSVKE